MTERPAAARVRPATAGDEAQLFRLWGLLYDEDDAAAGAGTSWTTSATAWFARTVTEPTSACFPVVEVDGELVATAIGTLEVGVPNPHCPRGRTVRLANVVTLPAHRGRGLGTLVVRDVVAWARSIDADRVDLSATADGGRLYRRLGFVPTTAPRMKLVL